MSTHTTHVLKCVMGPFEAVLQGRKRFEYRRDDRDFQVGDLLELQEVTTPLSVLGTVPTGRSKIVEVTYILRGSEAEFFGVPPGYTVLSIADPTREP